LPAEPPPAAAPPPEPSAIEREHAALKDRYLRLMADFDNHRRRTARERDDLFRRASEALLQELLPIVDHLDLALRKAPAGADAAFVAGVRLVYDQLNDVLARAGLEAIDAHGQVFDPNLHEAVTALPSAEVPENTVIEQTRRGYRAGDRLLRAAQVIVSSGTPAPAAAEAPPEPKTVDPSQD
jgi:molecular chaperone GrpE